MNLGNIKLPITIIGVIVAQAFGIIWYVAQLDSTVKNLDISVAEIKETQADIDIAVLQTEVNSLKDEINNNKFDPSEIEDLIKGIDERVHIIELNIALIINDYKDILADHKLMMEQYDIKTSETYKNYGDK
jgi:hypothetical protein